MLEQKKSRPRAPMGVRDVQRLTRSVCARIDDPEALAQALEIVSTLEREVAAAALRLHEEGHSFTDLGRACGTTRQTAQERWTRAWKRLGLTTTKEK